MPELLSTEAMCLGAGEGRFTKLRLPDPYTVRRQVILRGHEVVGLLDPTVLIGLKSDEVAFVSGKNGVIRLSADIDLLTALIACGGVLLGSGAEVEEIQRQLDSPAMSRTIAWLCTTMETCGSVIRASDLLRRSSVSVLGCGGVGSLSALLLAGAGVSRIVLYDPDVVEESNLNRQLFFTQADVGRPKIEVLKKSIEERFPSIRVEAVRERISLESASSAIEGRSAVLLTADEPIGLASAVVPEALRSNQIVVTTGYRHQVASVAAWTDWPHSSLSSSSWLRLQHGVMPSFGPTNAELAGKACAIIVRRLIGLQCNVSECYEWDTTKSS